MSVRPIVLVVLAFACGREPPRSDAAPAAAIAEPLPAPAVAEPLPAPDPEPSDEDVWGSLSRLPMLPPEPDPIPQSPLRDDAKADRAQHEAHVLELMAGRLKARHLPLAE